MTETEIVIAVKVPVLELRPNGRPHWAAKMKAAKIARGRARLSVLTVLGWKKPPIIVAYSLRYYWAARHWDDDNAIASPKSYMDGIADALGIDDRTLRFRELIRLTDRKNPRLEIILHMKPTD